MLHRTVWAVNSAIQNMLFLTPTPPPGPFRPPHQALSTHFSLPLPHGNTYSSPSSPLKSKLIFFTNYMSKTTPSGHRWRRQAQRLSRFIWLGDCNITQQSFYLQLGSLLQ